MCLSFPFSFSCSFFVVVISFCFMCLCFNGGCRYRCRFHLNLANRLQILKSMYTDTLTYTYTKYSCSNGEYLHRNILSNFNCIKLYRIVCTGCINNKARRGIVYIVVVALSLFADGRTMPYRRTLDWVAEILISLYSLFVSRNRQMKWNGI